MFENSSLEIDVAFENVINDEEPVDLANRATSLPCFDVARFAAEAMADGDWDAELERPTVEIPPQRLTALVSKSIPPTCVIPSEQFVRVCPSFDRVSSARAFSLSKRWAHHR